MTNEMKYLMHLYACAATSVSAAPPTEPIDFEALYALADKMSLLSMLSYAMKISPDIGCPDALRQRLYSVMLGTALKNKMRLEAVVQVLDEIEQRGIRAVVLKGLDCSRFYAKPECRISADTDLFVEASEEEALLRYFEEAGCTVRRRGAQQHHSSCFHRHAGLFEVHTKICGDSVFKALCQKGQAVTIRAADSVPICVNGTQLRVPEATDAAIFLTFHMVKHFWFGECNLKMTYDLALYCAKNKARIDAERYRKWVREAGYETIVSAAFSAMERYCGFAEEAFSALTQLDAARAEVFVDCIEQYDSGADAQCSRELILQYCASQSKLRKKGRFAFLLGNARRVISAKGRALFPSLTHLRQRYPYLEKHPYLYPVAWAHRFFRRGTKHVFHGDPRDGSILHYKKTLRAQMSDADRQQIETLKGMNLL